MHQKPFRAYVCFCTGRLRRKRPAIWRWKRIDFIRFYAGFLSWLVRFLTRCDLAHVAIGDGRVVLDPAIVGNRYWPFEAYLLGYPTRAWLFTVPCDRCIELGLYEERPPRWKPAIPTFMRWITRGLWPTRDCVAIARECLVRGGLDVPRTVVTPAHLFDYLRGEGFELTQLG